MWFWLAIAAMICWSGSDLFSKIGCRDSFDKQSHLKMATAVGVVMGLHALYEILTGTEISFDIILKYLPVSVLYILSMIIGYMGLRYIELSVSSPVCNASGALVAFASFFLMLFSGGIEWDSVTVISICAVLLVCAGVIGLGLVEHYEDDTLRAARQEASNYKYSKSVLALLLPILYCVLDAAGTFADSLVLASFEKQGISEASANVAYELTFFACGLVSFIYLVFFKKAKYTLRHEVPKYTGAVFETVGQFAYIFALADEEHVMFSAPIISSYCLFSVLWSRIFLKEKLSFKHYLMIAVAAVGIVTLGTLDP